MGMIRGVPVEKRDIPGCRGSFAAAPPWGRMRQLLTSHLPPPLAASISGLGHAGRRLEVGREETTAPLSETVCTVAETGVDCQIDRRCLVSRGGRTPSSLERQRTRAVHFRAGWVSIDSAVGVAAEPSRRLVAWTNCGMAPMDRGGPRPRCTARGRRHAGRRTPGGAREPVSASFVGTGERPNWRALPPLDGASGVARGSYTSHVESLVPTPCAAALPSRSR